MNKAPIVLRTFYRDVRQANGAGDQFVCAGTSSIDPGEASRYKRICKIFRGRSIYAKAFPALGVPEGDEYHVFFSAKDNLREKPGIFGCVIISQDRMETFLKKNQVSEAFALYVREPGESLKNTVERWARNVLGMHLPELVISLVVGSLEE